MSLSISPTTADVNANRTQTFVASGGTGPYTFSMVSGVGSIGSSSGIYTAPNSPGTAVIQVTDSAITPATVQATITVKNVLTRVCDIIQGFMGLNADQVYVWDEKIKIPTDTKIYITVAQATPKVFGTKREYVSAGGGLQEQITLQMACAFQIDIFGKTSEARDRKEEVLMALSSTLSQQTQEANGFYVAPQSTSFVNLSEIDGAAIPYRFTISVNVQYQVSKTPQVDYYDTYDYDLVTED